ncbi:TPA: beta-CASP ribonuclease aCPSF1 [archaeon]|nr:beta-CASP ribonuclease aCPSF1 [Candidatus Naiadarchaeales archaeon SRR2090153.bin1042]
MAQSFLEELKAELPEDADVTKAQLEGSRIVIYTKTPEYFADHPDLIKKLVSRYKKRIDLRAHPSILLETATAEKFIKELIPKEAEITDIIFMPEVSKVIIEAKKPGLVIGKSGKTLHELKRLIKWAPHVERTPSIPSQITKVGRKVLYTNAEERRKFLESLGKKVPPKKLVEEESGEKWVRVTALGGFREVGRSAILVQTNESQVLVDCGVNVAIESVQSYPYFNAPEFDINTLDAVIVTHAHLDHSGLIPYLYKYGYKGPVYSTPATRDLMTLLQLDYVEIAQREAKKIPYTQKDIEDAIKHSIAIDYGEVTDITPDIRLTLYNAGHILGSSQVHLHVGEGLHNLIYTGDLKAEGSRLFGPAETEFMRLETLIMESTYGGKADFQPPRGESEKRLFEIIEEAIKTKAKVLIPVLAVGRAQEVMVIIEEFARRKKLENSFNIYLDGMIWDATAIHTAYPEYLSESIRQRIFHEDENPFLNPIFKRVGSQKERMEVIESSEPVLIMATSGMLTGGPSVEYLKHLAETKKNWLVFVSYQGEGTLGRRVQKGWDKITLENEKGKQEVTEIKLHIETLEGFSGHSDREALMRFAEKVSPRPDRVLVCHGDNNKCLDLASSIHKAFNVDTYAPKNLETIRLR